MALNEELKILIQFESTAERVPGLRSLSCVSVNVAALVLNGWSFLALMKCLFVFYAFFLNRVLPCPCSFSVILVMVVYRVRTKKTNGRKIYVLLICKLLLFLFLLILIF